MKKGSSSARREIRSIVIEMEGPHTIYCQMGKSFCDMVLDENSPYTYQELLNHYSLLWSEYAERKNKKRKKNPVDPTYFQRQNKPFEQMKELKINLMKLLRDRALYIDNLIEEKTILIIEHEEA